MPILALLLMNVPVAEAKFEWPEGSIGNFAMVGLVFTSIIVGSGILGTLVYLFRTLFGIPHEGHTETDRLLREYKEWLDYIRWIATQNPTTHPVDEGAAVRVLDLEKQLFEEPPPTRALPVRFFKCLIRTAKSFSTSVTSRGNSTNEDSRRDKGKAPVERHIPPHPLIPIATGEGLKIGVYHDIYPATAAYRSRKVTTARRSIKSAHRHRSAKIVRDPGEIGIHYASYKPRGASIKSTDKTKSTTTKDGGKVSAYDPKRRYYMPHIRFAISIF